MATLACAVSWDGNGDGTNWGDPINWLGNALPGAGDPVTIGDLASVENDFVRLNITDSVAGVAITDGMRLTTDGNVLTVTGDTTIAGRNDTGIVVHTSRLNVERGVGPDDYDTDNLTVSDEASVELSEGGILEIDNVFTLQATTALRGEGVVDFEGSNTRVFINDGVIAPGTGHASDTVLNQNGTGRLDLDGNSGNGRIDVNLSRIDGSDHARLVINGDELADTFSSEIFIGDGNVLTMNLTNGWTADASSTIRFSAGNDSPAPRLEGSTATISGSVEALFGASVINAGVIFSGAPSVTVGVDDELELNGTTSVLGGTYAVDDGGLLEFDGGTFLSGGTFNNQGTGLTRFDGATAYNGGPINVTGSVDQNGTANVNIDTSVNGDQLDMDGFSGNTVWTLDALFIANVDEIDDGNNNFGGTINVNGGNLLVPARLEINLPGNDEWTMSGAINVNGLVGGFISSTLSGSDMNLTGSADVTNANRWTARVDLLNGSTVTINAGGTLQLTGGSVADPNTIAGGTVTGAGTLAATTGDALTGFGTISAAIDFDNDARLIAENGTLSLNGTLIDAGTIGTNGGSAVLEVNAFWNTNFADEVRLNQGQLTGGVITNSGTLIGRGFIGATGLRNNGLLAGDGGTLFVDVTNVLILDLDGTNNAGVIEAILGSVQIENNFAVQPTFAGTLNVGVGQSYTMLFDGIDNIGQVTMTGGTYVAPAFAQSANLDVMNNPSTLETNSVFNPGSTTSLAANLLLDGDTVVEPGALFNGAATLVNLNGSNLQLRDGSVVGVNLQNDGVLDIGDSPGIATVEANATLTGTSDVPIEIGGVVPGQFDRLLVDGNIALDGTLTVQLVNGFVPVLNNSFIIFSSQFGNRVGVFDTINKPVLAGTAQLFPDYEPTLFQLRTTFPGDFDFDGDVDLADFNILAANFGLAGGTVYEDGDADEDGDVDLADFNILAANFGLGAEVIAALPEPGALSMLILGVGGCLTRRRAAGR